MGRTTEGLLLRAEQSAELVAVFQTVAEAEAEGEARFHPALIRALAQAVVCRTYATALLELMHLLRIAAASDPRGRYEHFFWGLGPARAERFRHHLLTRAKAGQLPRERFAATPAGVEVRYADGAFTISHGRMPFLTALMEFLVTALGYGEVDTLARGLLMDRFTQAATSQHANTLARRLYDYLKERLPTVQQQRKFHHMVGFLEESFGETFQADVIRDEVILRFWLRESLVGEGEGLDFKTFAAVSQAFVRLRQTLERACDLDSLDNPLPIGPDRDAGELDPSEVARLVEVVEEDNPLDALAAPPMARIKFLNQRERDTLDPICAWGRTAWQLPLTVLRCQVFGATQLRLTQALRRKAEDAELVRLIADAPEDYGRRMEALNELSRHLQRMLLASLAALLKARHGATVTALLALRPELDLTSLSPRPGRDNIVPFQPKGMVERFLTLLEEGGLGQEVATLLQEATRALRGLSRQGFGAEELKEGEVVEGFAQGVELLPRLNRHLNGFLATVTPPEAVANHAFHEDQRLFAEQFRRIYAAPEESIP